MTVEWFRDPVNFITNWLNQFLLGWGLPAGVVAFLMNLIGAGLVATGAMLFCILLIWYERKLYGRIQDRLGPNRVGPWGIFQPFADMLKIFAKEYITPRGADVIPYNLAPILAVAAVLLIWAVIPFYNGAAGANLNTGALYIIAVGGLGELAIILAGIASNNKYALLGGFRAIALLLSYEVPMVLALLVPVLLARSMGMNDIVQAQGDVWYIVMAPIAAFIFFLTSVAEVGRAPFDIIEAESEIVAGFNIEYSGLKFGMFYVGEFLHAFTVSVLFAILFLGGWRGPFVDQVPVLGAVWLLVKTGVTYFLIILLRGSMPRYRTDQTMSLAWKILTPLALAVLVLTAILDKALVGSSDLVRGLALVGMNLVVWFIASRLSQASYRRSHPVEPPIGHAPVINPLVDEIGGVLE
ncbi:MAG TPA: NADH-quinone oxidoreductase subunit NuoH [Anaerolineaceae bacterium]|nr:NADH-quinone oxidoreductase subunit NuoH [Anaerolineaceae bacterium]